MKKLNVFFAVMDAVRPDHLSCYSYPKKTTPNIEEVAKESVLFQNAFSAAPWTPPSHASIFTGMYPSQHGVLGKNLYLSEKIPTLAEIFASMGYETLGMSKNPWVGSQTGLHRGFERFVANIPPTSRLSLDWIDFCVETDISAIKYRRWARQIKIFQEIKKWILRCQKKNKHFFIFVNYLDAHTPYDPPQPFKNRFERIYHPNVNKVKIKDIFNDRHGYPYVAKESEISKEEWDVVKSWYDGAISFIDFFLGKLFDFLKKRELYDDTITIITSDHGENFGEHELANHMFCLYDTLLHVPLIIKFPECIFSGERISSIVSTIDIFSTLLNILDEKIERKFKVSGVNLFPSENTIYHEHIFAEDGPPVTDINSLKRLCPNVDQSICDKYNKGLKCVRTRDFKYIIASDGKEELYDLHKDPGETRNVIDDFPEKAEKLRSILVTELKSSSFKGFELPAIDYEMRKRLQALGYV